MDLALVASKRGRTVFGWLNKKKQEPRQIDDAVFGPLTWVPSLSCWEGKVLFAPANADVFLRISAKEEEPGPGEAQHTVFRHIVERYEDLISAVGTLFTALVRRGSGGRRQPSQRCFF